MRAQQRLDQATECASLALTLAPDHVEALALASLVLRDAGKAADAIAYFERAIAVKPDHAAPHVALAEALLAAGRLAEGAAKYEWRWRQTPMPEWPVPLWDGRVLGDGSALLLWSDSGASETLRLIRLVGALHAFVGRVVVAAPAELRWLLASAPGVNDVVPIDGPYPRCDVHLPIGSLPHRLALGGEAVPAETPYLAIDSARAGVYGPLLAGGGIKVGLAWSGEAGVRAPRLTELAPLFAIPTVRLFALDPAGPTAALAGLGDKIVDLSACLADIANAAAVIDQLDMVIAVDGQIAHIAGALGRPGWVSSAVTRIGVGLPATPTARGIRRCYCSTRTVAAGSASRRKPPIRWRCSPPLPSPCRRWTRRAPPTMRAIFRAVDARSVWHSMAIRRCCRISHRCWHSSACASMPSTAARRSRGGAQYL